jgi:hypothetical protein
MPQEHHHGHPMRVPLVLPSGGITHNPQKNKKSDSRDQRANAA